EDVGEGEDRVLEVLAEDPDPDDLEADAGDTCPEGHEAQKPWLLQQVGIGVTRGVDGDRGGLDRGGGRGVRAGPAAGEDGGRDPERGGERGAEAVAERGEDQVHAGERGE